MVSEIEEYEGYCKFHARRYRHLCDTFQAYYDGSGSVAVFGAAQECEFIRGMYPDVTIDAFGIERDTPGAIHANTYTHLDMNTRFVVSKRYRVGICSEVVEHLTRPFVDVLNDLLDCCNVVIIQTPNARALYKRLWCLTTMSPFEFVRLARGYGHLYEYTLNELTEGLPVVGITAVNYFGGDQMVKRVYNCICGILPIEFRDGFTIVYGRRSDTT